MESKRQRQSCVRSWNDSSRNSSRSEEHTSELQSHLNLVCRLLLEKKKKITIQSIQKRLPKALCTFLAGWVLFFAQSVTGSSENDDIQSTRVLPDASQRLGPCTLAH